MDYYVPSFLAMVNELSRITHIDVETLKAAFKRVHERYRTTEYSFAIQELDILKKTKNGLTAREVNETFGSAIRQFRQTRKRTLRLYDGVAATLSTLRDQGKRIAAATESLEFHACYRLKQLGIEQFFDGLVAPPDHGFPRGTTPEDVRYFSDENYHCSVPIRITPEEKRKPEPGYLLPLLEEMHVSTSECLLVGDSLYRDVLLAKQCGIYGCLAKYGQSVDPVNFAELLKITYWTEEDMRADGELKLQPIQPDFVVNNFGEVLSIVEHLDSSS